MHDGQRRLYATPSRSEEGMRKTAMSAVRLVERLLLAQHCSRRRPLQSHKKVTVARTSEHGSGGWEESKWYREGTPLMAEVSGWRHVTAAVPIELQRPDRLSQVRDDARQTALANEECRVERRNTAPTLRRSHLHFCRSRPTRAQQEPSRPKEETRADSASSVPAAVSRAKP